MSIKPVLARLLRLRGLEEEQSRLELENTAAALGRVEQERAAVTRRQAMGRRVFVTGIEQSDNRCRPAAVIEMELAQRQRAQVDLRLTAIESEVERQRDEFLERRTRRQQVETLVDAARAESEVTAARRAQQMLDDWYGRRGPKQ